MNVLLDHPWALFLATLALLLIVAEAGARLAVATGLAQDVDRHDQLKQLRDWILIFLSLLLGFTLALAAPHFEYRSQLVISEASAMRTTYLRTKTLPEPYRTNLGNALARYIDARLESLSSGDDQPRIDAARASTKHIQDEMWSEYARLTQTDRSPVTAGFVESLTELTVLEGKETAALDYRVPVVVWVLVLLVSVLGALSSGLAQRKRFWLATVTMPLMVSTVIALIDEFDSPRGGFLAVDVQKMSSLQADIRRSARPSQPPSPP